MKIEVVRCDGKTEIITLTEPLEIIRSDAQNRLVTSTGMEHFFTQEGRYDGWGMNVRYEIAVPVEGEPRATIPEAVKSMIEAVERDRELPGESHEGK